MQLATDQAPSHSVALLPKNRISIMQVSSLERADEIRTKYNRHRDTTHWWVSPSPGVGLLTRKKNVKCFRTRESNTFAQKRQTIPGLQATNHPL